VTEAILDRLGAQEQLAGGPTGGEPAAQQQRNLQLARGQLVQRADITPARRLAGRGKLG
jgi:hypothetical protein